MANRLVWCWFDRNCSYGKRKNFVICAPINNSYYGSARPEARRRTDCAHPGSNKRVGQTVSGQVQFEKIQFETIYKNKYTLWITFIVDKQATSSSKTDTIRSIKKSGYRSLTTLDENFSCKLFPSSLRRAVFFLYIFYTLTSKNFTFIRLQRSQIHWSKNFLFYIE